MNNNNYENSKNLNTWENVNVTSKPEIAKEYEVGLLSEGISDAQVNVGFCRVSVWVSSRMYLNKCICRLLIDGELLKSINDM